MLTKNEVSSLSLSPTKKDFVQIWNELLEVAGKLSERWDPTSTNESDPGIVILKALAGIADKLNYNIDKNTLEAFMPTAAQEDSMRKLCDMLGYSIKYYRSAVANVTISYRNPDPSKEESDLINTGSLYIPKFTVVTNSDQDISYFTINPVPLSISAGTSVSVDCMEGQLVKCESASDNNVITINQISENNRFYLPETHIAENGVFIYNVFNSGIDSTTALEDGEQWERVDNLNIQRRGSKKYKFGFDSYESRPYIEFPEDYSELFEDGIFIYYTRTNGVNGNISEGTLTQLELPANDSWSKVSAESFQVVNAFPATTGANIETIKQAYNNFKKTIGTFETLVTCRDYMNKIYSMIDDTTGKPYVSNILVTDIRNDINRAITICSCDDAGIFYKETPLFTGTSTSTSTISTPVEIAGELELKGIVPGAEPILEESNSNNPAESEEDGETVTIEFDFNKPYFDTTNVCWRYGGRSGGETLYTQDIDDGLTNDKYPGYTKRSDFDDNKPGIHVEGAETDENGVGVGVNKDGKKCWTIDQVNVEGNVVTFYTNILVPITEYTPKVKTRTIKETYVRTDTANYVQTNKVETEKHTTTTVKEDYAIDHFDLIFYPFKRYNQIRGNKSILTDIRDAYDASFEYSNSSFDLLKSIFDSTDSRSIDISNTSVMAHNIKAPRPREGDRDGDILSINNYLRLNATIATNSKVTIVERESIIHNIKVALANAFNMRELDFGEEIPFDSIVDVIESADSRIRVAALNEPALYTTFSVLDSIVNGVPVIKEYAVASAHLTEEQAEATGRFVDGTFNTKKAKEIYNKLAARNVLAGRVPLFKYDNTFETSFSEGAYLVTEPSDLSEAPSDLEKPTPEAPFTIYTKDDIIYTGQFNNNEITYKKTSVKHPDNVIKQINNEAITDIEAGLTIAADNNANITDVTLAPGEFIKFRAPNFVTLKTYPAYVNYHLKLATETRTRAANASAQTLFELLNEDVNSWSATNQNIRWQKVLDHFGAVDKQYGTKYKQTITLKQTVSKYAPVAATGSDLCPSIENSTGQHELDPVTKKCKYCGVEMSEPVQKGPITIEINNKLVNDTKSIEAALAKAGCIKLLNSKAILSWDTSDGDIAPNETGPKLDFNLNISNPFVNNASVIGDINSAIDANIELLKGQLDNGSPRLPTECAWTIAFEFEYVPFEPASLKEWENFIKTKGRSLFGFAPVAENDNIFWRISDSGYQSGKYVRQSSEKLLKFSVEYFGLLDSLSNRLYGIYLASDLGRDAEPVVINNDEEYMLGAGEYLYIEYTPSTTTEEGKLQALAAIKEIHGPGTIIKPSGFTTGLIDSTIYARDVSPAKSVLFEVPNASGGVTNTELSMFSFGANEQVEIRDFANVTLEKDSFKLSPAIYIYKNFNNCKALEESTSVNPRSYTLKDGEYIFYTDLNKTEFAYVGAGTEVTLKGSIRLEQFDILTLSEIFEGGIQAIPWSYLPLKDGDSITFQEYQYIVLGAGDTLNKATLLGDEIENITSDCLTDQWQWCNDVQYSVAGENIQRLPNIKASLSTNSHPENSNGWQTCSTLELDVSPNTSQTLRKTDNLSASLTLKSLSSGGDIPGNGELTLAPGAVGDTLSIKTNLACQTSGSKMNIKNVFSNPNKLKGFEFKIFAADAPSIVKTERNSVIPHRDTYVTDIAKWVGEPIEAKKYLELWNYVDLKNILPVTTDTEPYKNYDRALKLSTGLLENTYGVFCIYLNYTSTEPDAKTWIEVIPGTKADAVTLINGNSEVKYLDAGKTKLSKLYLQPGINCVRVNKTGNIFIKSEKAQGALYFDDIKLVDCTPLEYTINGETYTSATHGLNIKQLGYLNPNDVIDRDMSRKLMSDYVENTLVVLNAEDTKAKAVLDHRRNKFLTDAEEKLLEIKDFTEKAKKELDFLQSNYPKSGTKENDDLTKLFAQYKQINETLSLEKDLFNALNEKDSKNIEGLNQRLVDLLNRLSTLEADQKQLQADLENLIISAKANLETFSDNEVLNAFPESVDDAVLKKLKDVCVEKVEVATNDRLAELISSLEITATSSERNRLLEILQSLYTESSSKNRADLLAKVNRLSEIVNQEEGISLLETAYSAAVIADYPTVVNALNQLKTQLSTEDIKLLIAEIIAAVDESADERLRDLITELTDVIENPPIILNDLQKAINEVESCINNGTTDVSTIVIGMITELRTDLLEARSDKLSSLLEEISTLLNKLSNDAFLNAIKQLSTFKTPYNEKEGNIQISNLIAELTVLINTRATDLTTIKNATNTKVFDMPYGKEAVLDVWPNELKQTALDGIETIYNSLTDIISTPAETAALVSPFKQDTTKTLLETKINFTAFEAIVAKTIELAKKQSQNNSNAGFIDSTKLPVPNNVAKALTNISKATSDRIKLLRDIIGKLSGTTSVAERYKLSTELQVELNNAISIDAELSTVAAKLLCPSILLFSKENADTAKFYKSKFFEPFIEKIEDIQNKFISEPDPSVILSNSSTNISNILDYECELANVFADIALIKTIELTKYTILPEDFKTQLQSIQSVAMLIANLATAKSAGFFETNYFIKNSTLKVSETITIWLQGANLQDTSEKVDVEELIRELVEKVILIEKGTPEFEESFSAAYNTFKIEEQLLEDIRKLDVGRDFYYSAPADATIAIDFNESDETLNTLMNPLTNYDINNINNSFVISKLDIDYLDTGLQIARSSRLG